jgi:hypothetical protein
MSDIEEHVTDLREAIERVIKAEIRLHVADQRNPESTHSYAESEVDCAYKDLDGALTSFEEAVRKPENSP